LGNPTSTVSIKDGDGTMAFPVARHWHHKNPADADGVHDVTSLNFRWATSAPLNLI
jgi:hypothetical protein